MAKDVELLGAVVENIRGFSNTFIPLDKSLSILVGANNAGKTSIFKVLQWVFSIDPDDLQHGYSGYLSDDDMNTLRPARNVRNKASRISLRIRVIDGRKRRKFGSDESGVSTLRINFKLSNNRFYISASKPSRGETPQHTTNGIELLRLLLSNYNFVYISPDRIGSDIFSEYSLFYMSNRFRNKPGPPSAPRKHFMSAVENLSAATSSVIDDIKRLVTNKVPSGYLRDLSIRYDLDTDSLISWIARQVIVEATTGIHDRNKVSIKELGTGLLALITLLLQGAWADRDSKTTILAIEEPEAFLHPPAQRTLAQHLFNSDTSRNNTPLLISTHSPIIVEEADYCSTYVISSHKIYQPTCTESSRNEINSAFLSGHGAEMLFYSNILLVEGEADYLFFYTVMRRLAKYDSSGIINDIKIVPVGGNERFAPWIKLLSSFSRSPDKPFKYLILADGDSPKQVRRAAQDAELDMPKELAAALDEVAERFSSYKSIIGSAEQATIDAALQSWISSCEAFNQVARSTSFPFRLMPGDLEYTILKHVSNTIIEYICDVLGIEECNNRTILRRLGSKTSGYKVPNDAKKQPWIRQKVGERLKSPMVQGNLKQIIIDILQVFNIDKQRSQRILEKLD